MQKDFCSASKAKVQMNSPILWLLVLVFGFYFIGEHGVLNWLLLYCKDQFGMDSNQASIYLSMFSGTMMVGRLVMAPLVQKWGPSRSIQIFGGIGTVLYAVGIFCGKPTLMLVGISGLLYLSFIQPFFCLYNSIIHLPLPLPQQELLSVLQQYLILLLICCLERSLIRWAIILDL